MNTGTPLNKSVMSGDRSYEVQFRYNNHGHLLRRGTLTVFEAEEQFTIMPKDGKKVEIFHCSQFELFGHGPINNTATMFDIPFVKKDPRGNLHLKFASAGDLQIVYNRLLCLFEKAGKSATNRLYMAKGLLQSSSSSGNSSFLKKDEWNSDHYVRSPGPQHVVKRKLITFSQSNQETSTSSTACRNIQECFPTRSPKIRQINVETNIKFAPVKNGKRLSGYRLSNQFYNILVHKFDRTHSGHIIFDDFVQLCVVLQTLTASFRDKDADRDGVITVGYEEFRGAWVENQTNVPVKLLRKGLLPADHKIADAKAEFDIRKKVATNFRCSQEKAHPLVHGTRRQRQKPAIGRSEYGRVKVALPPGKGLMDWVRLSTGKALAKKRLSSVDHEELKKHNTEKDCWIHIFGQVYDVTEYLDFHPGGVPELMKAAGRDGTNLFNQYHAWVNYESMLKSCLVGRFVGDLSKLPPCGPPTVDESSTSIVAQIKNNAVKQQDSHGIRVRTTDNSITISHDDWVSLEAEHVSVNMHEKLLRVLIRHPKQPSIEIKWVDLKTALSTSWEVVVDCDNKIIIQFSLDNGCTGNLGSFAVRKRPIVEYHQFSIIDKEQVTRDTFLFHIQSCSGQQIRLPFGHHVSMKIRKGASTIYRPYTPIESYVENNCTFMKLMIKIYSDGICTPTIAKLDQGDKLELSDPIGDFNISIIKPMDDLIMLAAGTGITPMLPILTKRVSEDSRGNNLMLLYNKTEDDIPSLFLKPDSQLTTTVENILSTPTELWNGRKGRITAAHLPALDRNCKVLLCGPDGFLSAANRLLEDSGIPTTNVHIFQG